MNKTLLKTTMIAAIATLGLNGQVWAHHPSEEMNPNFEMVDEQVSDMHNEVIDAMIEDGDMMSSTTRGMDGSSTQTQVVGGATMAAQTQATSSTMSGPGRGRR